MCEIYSGAEPELFELKTRSIRIDGVVTSVRLEAIFWQIIEEIAEDAELSVAVFLTRIYREVLTRHGQVANFASLLRVACTTHLNQGQRLVLKPKMAVNAKSS
ncbi:ribbon-helix-helix domain-containing protein [Shewanella xiamenensis]|uniref:ribbon-helix-helix domain-containing protein n=1 Tax=Shewanella xiamenensis TaxID=332186 RepID=UPI002446FDB2|nr:ribbon-helix-helix domain-containing protein [Shewanella xiamenensis]MDH1316406.1 ribbon-helix-helix domain-containing protein [Shewanella xiamenensis]MDI5836646.1 ribbon-helix-helix domain-containing protein [Shewanella xiamenensis]MDI5840103.1 ribbon-helix-helix domain-containing protein [Shewanella xiamenensis]MDI5844094.1 ribbon-helix-helix domain-containing protein [Shewanella xiamenensis]MDI5847535.1 ribbon-helix-helix domain-containing protein [Shewanella xiamenensis]